jgi:hypothetical protein
MFIYLRVYKCICMYIYLHGSSNGVPEIQSVYCSADKVYIYVFIFMYLYV